MIDDWLLNFTVRESVAACLDKFVNASSQLESSRNFKTVNRQDKEFDAAAGND